MGTRPFRQRVRRRRQVVVVLACGAAVVLAGLAGALWWVFAGAAPRLDGTVALANLSAAVQVQRDAAGVPTVTAASREDLARAMGFLHAQERFFQMDLLRRSGAGEIAELAGEAALPIDIPHRVHRFRARAEALLARMPAAQQALLRAYAACVNAGLAGLSLFASMS